MNACVNHALDAVAVKDALGRILQTPEFQRNRTVSQFLKFIVEETLEGRGDKIKAFTIATLALERGSTFDPQSDSIVRVQAGRLRQMLEAYYAGEGASDAVRIVLPRGGYRPDFVIGEPADPALLQGVVESSGGAFGATSPTDRDAQAQPRGRNRMAKLVGASLAALLVAAPLLWFYGDGNSGREVASQPHVSALQAALNEPPIVSVEIEGAEDDTPEATAFLTHLRKSITSGLSAWDHLDVRNSGTVPPGPLTYKIVIASARLDEKNHNVSMQLVHVATQRVIGGLETNDVDVQQWGPQAQAMLRFVVTVGGDTFGAIANDVERRMRESGGPLTGARCRSRAMEYVRFRSLQAHADGLQCLEADLAAQPHDLASRYILSVLLMRRYSDNMAGSRGKEDLDRAYELAAQALAIAPLRARSHGTLAVLRFYQGDFDGAHDAAVKAIKLNPYSALAIASIAYTYILRERFDEGLALIAPFEAMPTGLPSHFSVQLGFVAFMRDDRAKLQSLAMRPSFLATPGGILLRAIACHRKDDAACARDAANALRRDYPGVASDIPGAFRRYQMTENMARKLLAELAETQLFDLKPAAN